LTLAESIRKLVERQSLTRAEMAAAMKELATGAASPAQIGAFLVALRVKGETVDELVGATEVVRALVDRVQVDGTSMDTCGTGGDGRNTFNISTASALVVAAAGVTVAKHGNRSVSSRCGSADVLSALGVRIELPKAKVEECLRRLSIGFLFAPKLHPCVGAVAAVRTELGVRTLFNLLGPLANPAGADHQLLGVFAPSWVPVVGQVLATLGTQRAWVVHGDGLDEVSVSAETLVCEAQAGQVREFRITPEELGLSRHPMEALAGGDVAHNARMLRDVLGGQKGAPRDAVVANAGAALLVCGAAPELLQGVKLAAQLVDSGAAAAKLAALVKLTAELE
jgi:anthranilate phosphoribosyltransferase